METRERKLVDWFVSTWHYRTSHVNDNVDWALANWRICQSDVCRQMDKISPHWARMHRIDKQREFHGLLVRHIAPVIKDSWLSSLRIPDGSGAFESRSQAAEKRRAIERRKLADEAFGQQKQT